MIDTHAHLFLCKRPLDELVHNAKAANVIRIVNPSLDKASWELAKAQEALYPGFIFSTPGIYPGKEKDLTFLKEIETLASEQRIAAIGEIGLDQYRVTMPINQQIDTFEAQLDIAERTQTPVIIHNRHADHDIIACCNRFPKVKKVFHCFGSGPQHIEALLSDTTYFSFTATITYVDSGKAIQGLKSIPLERIMIETDCPYLTPRPFGKDENQPAYVSEIAKKIAAVKQVDLQTVLETTTQTALSFFKFVKLSSPLNR